MEKYRFWFIPQVPGDVFHYPVKRPRDAALVYDAVALFSLFEYDHNIKPDYASAAGLEVFEDGEWVEWENENCEALDECCDELLAED